MFDFENIILLLIGLANFGLTLFIFAKNSKSRINISFSFFTFFCFLWTMGIFFYRGTNIDLWSIYLLKSTYISAIFISVSYYYFSIVFPENNPPSFFHKIFIFLPTAVISALMLFPNFLTKEVVYHEWGKEITLGKNEYIIFFLYFILFFIGGLIRSWKKYFSLSGTPRAQLLYIIISVSIAGFFGMIFNLILPSYFLHDFRFIWAGPIFTFLIVIMITYSILRYRLMDIKLFFGRGAVYFFSLATAVGIAFLLMILNDFYKLLDFKSAAPLMLAAGILAFNPFFKFYEKLASRYFYYKFYNYQTVLTDLSKKLNEVIELDKLAFLITDTLINTMRLDKTGILIRDAKTGKYEIQKIFGFKEDNGISLVKDNFLTEWLTKFKKPLVCEELTFAIRDARSDSERESVIKLGKNMNDIEASMCLPLLREDKIIGIIVLGKKISGEPYSKQDIDLLTHLTNQASIALENARLYKELNELSKNLENKINEQVSDIKELSEMKSQFLMIVDHQFRTPVSIIKGLASMLDENSVPEDKKAEFIKRLYLSSERLSVILDDIIIAQSLIGQKINPVFLENKLEEVIGDEIKKFLPQAEAKGIKFYFKKPEAPIPFMLFDKNMITTVISRLIDNAILYTKNGEVAVLLSLENKNNKEFAKIEVKDTGIGFLDKNTEATFKLFSRSKEAILAHPNGSGLGLFIAKKFVEAHSGEIEIKSEGKDKGTLVTISLPIITEI